jgi:hypothetical protein
MAKTLRDGCIVTDSSIDKQAARARSEKVRDEPDPVSLATRRRWNWELLLTCMVPTLFRKDMSVNEMKVKLKEFRLRLPGN